MSEKRVTIPKSSSGHLNGIHYFSKTQPSLNNKEKSSIIIMCHGFTGDKYEWGRYPKTAKAFNKEGFDIIIFDFSGSGENERELVTLSKQVQDLKDVFSWVREKGYKWIAVLGLSFGGLTCVAANLSNINTMILWAPVLDYKETFEDEKLNLFKILDNLWKRPLKLPSSGKGGKILVDKSFVEDIITYDINSLLKTLTIPTLIIQGTEDPVVNPKTTRKAYKLMSNDELHDMIEIKGATHDFDGKFLQQFIDSSINWLKKIQSNEF